MPSAAVIPPAMATALVTLDRLTLSMIPCGIVPTGAEFL